MKGLKGVFCCLAVLVAVVLVTTAAQTATIDAISHEPGADGKERVTFSLNEAITPKIFTIKDDNPRLVLDFPTTTYKGKGSMTLAEGKLATAIRIGVHQEPEQKVRVVIDLAKGMAVSHASVASDRPNALIIELTGQAKAEGKVEGSAQNEALPVATAPPMVAPPQPVAPPKPVEEKPLPVPVPQAEKAPSPLVPAVSPTPAEKVSGLPLLRNISFDDSSAKGEMVLFQLNGFHPPSVSAVEKDTPRVFCDFMGMEMDKGVETTIAAKGKYVERISAGKQGKPEKVRVTLHLVPNRDYDLQQVFFKNDNLFVLIVNELPPGKSQ